MSNQYPSPNPSDPSYPSQVPPYQGNPYQGGAYPGNPYQGGAYPGNPYQQSAGGPQMPVGAVNGQQAPGGVQNGQQVPTAETPEEAARFKRKWVTYTVIFLIALVPLLFVIMIGNSFEFGEERLYWIVITSAVEFLFALGFFPFSAAVRRGIRQVTAQGKLEEAEKRRTGLYLSAFIAVVVGGYALYNGVPAAMDVADGQQSVTVTSCSYEQHKTEKRRRSH